MSLPSLIAFGALAPWPAPDRLNQLRDALRHQQSLEPIARAIQELPALWKALTDQDPSLKNLAGGEAAADHLAQWIVGMDTSQMVDKKRNITRMPMSTLMQISDYINYLGQADNSLNHGTILKSVAAGGGIQGFCIGLLSALAVASGKSVEEVGNYGADSVRLAFCVGAYIDLDYGKGESSKASTFAVRWKTPTTLENIQRWLTKYPESYIAAVRDIRDITITVPKSSAQPLLEDLSQSGVLVRDTGISGRYHLAIHNELPLRILKTCQVQFRPIHDGQSLVRSNADAHLFSNKDTALSALENILGERSNWYSTISTATASMNLNRNNPFILSFGIDAVPQSIAKSFPVVKSTLTADATEWSVGPRVRALELDSNAQVAQGYPEDAIAIIGMGCRFPGADSIDDFWNLLVEGASMLSEVPESRFGRGHTARSSKDVRFWGNFLQDIEAFDHGFFKKSPREAVSMDPQQRILLQVAYEALEESGYFAGSYKAEDFGCYIGACATDYDFNVASHPPTAYSATGTLRSFLSGKLSHYFGWSGPSLVIDTACSSSAVAIHTACTALKTRQCSQALAGGVTLMTSPYLFENFAAAHFLSPTGGSKPFSADADGYCRGEGCGLLVLKRLSDALRDNDHVLGVIAGSAVNQNDNCVPITVPHTSSQGSLYERVTAQAGASSTKITFVEAHGTGTPVGDPIEMESIRRVFGGPEREVPLIVSSVKGNIGHLEGASGVAALIKVILQMEHRLAPRQALFKTLNPKIPALEADNLCVPVSNLPLRGEALTACVNNYGAAGSNAALIVFESPRKVTSKPQYSATAVSMLSTKYPIQIAAASTQSLLLYCTALGDFCKKLQSAQNSAKQSQMLSDLMFNLAARLNQGLPFMFTTTVTDLDQLQTQLYQQTAESNVIKQRPKEVPLILCFGGQVSDKVALDKRLWQESTLFRSHLDDCDKALRMMGYPGLYPGIFHSETVTDVVVLHSIIFATQYACAKAWLDCGLKVAALVGHSFGQLTALCVSGMLSLHDGLRLVAGRASLMQKYWGTESGTMIAVETDQHTLEELRTKISTGDTSHDFEIACFNGQSSHVIVSNKATASELERTLSELGIRHRRLDVPYGFHSRFTEPLLPHLTDLASSLAFHKPRIPIETCTRSQSWSEPTATLISAHTREPVFFGEAIQRLQDRLGPCTWLEAGSDSSIVSMVRRTLGSSSATSHNFVPLQLNKPNSTDAVVDATVALWRAGHRVHYWNFHQSQKHHYDHIRLPSYAWEKSKHWLDLAISATLDSGNGAAQATSTQVALPPTLIRLTSSDSNGHHFVIDLSSDEYQTAIKDVWSSRVAACPPAFYVELVSRAIKITNEVKGEFAMLIHDLHVHSYLGLDSHQAINLDMRQVKRGWEFRIISAEKSSKRPELGECVCYAEGSVKMKEASDSLHEKFHRYERLARRDSLTTIRNDPRSESICGNVIYKMLARAVTYPDWYRGIKSMDVVDSRIISKVNCPVGIPHIISENTTIQLPLLESFVQVACLHANCWHDSPDSETLQFTGASCLQWRPGFDFHSLRNFQEGSWDVVAHASVNAGSRVYDMFIYDTTTAQLVLLMLGVQFANVQQPATNSIGFSPASVLTQSSQTSAKIDAAGIEREGRTAHQPTEELPAKIKISKQVKDPKKCIYDDICSLLEKLADIPKDQVAGDASFDDVGVDSLMMIEVISELSSLFRTNLPIDELEELTDINSLVDYLHGKGCVSASFVEDKDNESSSISDSTTQSTEASSPPTSPRSNAMTTPMDDTSPIAAEVESFVLAESKELTDTQPSDEGTYDIQQVFDRLKFDFEKYAKQTGALGFWTSVYPEQADLVCAYVIDALGTLGCNIAGLVAGQQLPAIKALPRHDRLVAQLFNILIDSGFLERRNDNRLFRTARTFDSTPTTTKFQRMLQRHPFHAPETRLLNATGPLLADCLTGQVDPLRLLFGDKRNRELLADFYANSPKVKAATHLLADFINAVSSTARSRGTLCILEVGAGTGGTTRYLVDFLTRHGVPYEYTFTDISQGLVSQAKRSFSGNLHMRFATFDCDQRPPQELLGKFHLVISTNCIHATSNLTNSTANILPMLREDGALCMLENTRNIYWFDLVFGLLEGWWFFSDGRQHALANESFWDSSLRAAGFKHVSWTDGDTEEAKTLRLICAFRQAAQEDRILIPSNTRIKKRAGIPMEELVWKSVGALDLTADVYFPKAPDPPGKKRPIALLIHGGGHFLFGRKDVPMKHIRTLIDRGFLPISTDYRLCPETNLFEGPMTDCCDALQWATETLPTLTLAGPTVRPDPNKVVSFGWSSGGQLAMSLGYTAPAKGVKAPDAVFALYPPSDMESDHWHEPCYPLAAEEEATEVLDILAGVRESAIIEYAPVSEKRTMALSLTLKDDRAKIILHMCWNSQTIPILVHGLPHKDTVKATDQTDWRYRPAASTEQVQAISPLWQIKQGNYKTPTFIVHGNGDDWLPLSMSERTIAELGRQGIPASLAVPEQCGHAFDLFPVGDPLDVGWTAIEQGYKFICSQLGMT